MDVANCFNSKMVFNLVALESCGKNVIDHRGGSRAAATSKMEHFVIIVKGFHPLTIITKHSILDVAGVLDPPLDQYLLFRDGVNFNVIPYMVLEIPGWFMLIGNLCDLFIYELCLIENFWSSCSYFLTCPLCRGFFK